MILKKESNAYIILILKSYQSLKLFKQECGFYYIKDGTVKVCNIFKMQVDINLYYLLSKNYKKNKCYYFFIWSSGNWTQGLMQVLYPEPSSQLVSLWTCNSSLEKPQSPLSLFIRKVIRHMTSSDAGSKTRHLWTPSTTYLAACELWQWIFPKWETRYSSLPQNRHLLFSSMTLWYNLHSSGLVHLLVWNI